MASSLYCEIDLSREGVQRGYLRLPHSVHRSAYGWIPIPIASVRNSEGPTVIIMAGNHGDEYEGQIIVSRLIRELRPEQVRGQIILLPMANYPAAAAGSRVSPIDDGNLNRHFPGKPDGTPTQMIAYHIEHVLMPGCKYVVDLHSGGSSLLYHGGCLLALDPGNDAARDELKTLMGHFGVPHACLLQTPNPVTVSSAARRQGAIAFVSELGGAGMVSPQILHHAWFGVLNFLEKVGVLVTGEKIPAPEKPTQFLKIEALRHHVYAYESGIFEPLVELGERVEEGDIVARLHHPDTPGREPSFVSSPGSGIALCKRVPALTLRGDCLFQLAEPL